MPSNMLVAGKTGIAQALRDIFNAPSREDAEELKGKVQEVRKECTGVCELADNVDEGLTVFDFDCTALFSFSLGPLLTLTKHSIDLPPFLGSQGLMLPRAGGPCFP